MNAETAMHTMQVGEVRYGDLMEESLGVFAPEELVPRGEFGNDSDVWSYRRTERLDDDADGPLYCHTDVYYGACWHDPNDEGRMTDDDWSVKTAVADYTTRDQDGLESEIGFDIDYEWSDSGLSPQFSARDMLNMAIYVDRDIRGLRVTTEVQ